MRIQIASSLLFALLLDHEWKGASAFGVVPPTRARHNNGSSLHAVEAVTEIVSTITNGGSGLVNAATAAVSSIGANPAEFAETAKSAVAGAIPNEIFGLSPQSAGVVGAVFGTNGYLIGTLAGSKGSGNSEKTKVETERLETLIQEKANEIEALNENLATAEEERSEAQTSGKESIDQLEEKIFLMDQEFEESTEVLKQDFEQRVQREVQNRDEKIKQDLKFSFDIKMMREREEMLQEKLAFVAQDTLAKQEETSLAKLEAAQSKSEIASLQNELGRSEFEIEDLKTMIRKGKNPFNSASVKLELAELQTEFAGMASVLVEKEQEIEEANRELAELKNKKIFQLPFFVTELFQGKSAAAVEEEIEFEEEFDEVEVE